MFKALQYLSQQSASARLGARVGYARRFRIYRLLFAPRILAGADLLVRFFAARCLAARAVALLASSLARKVASVTALEELRAEEARLDQSPRKRVCHICISARILPAPVTARA